MRKHVEWTEGREYRMAVDEDRMDLCEAVMELKRGKRVRRLGWEDGVELWPPDKASPYLSKRSAKGRQSHWVCLRDDLISDDWVLVETKPDGTVLVLQAEFDSELVDMSPATMRDLRKMAETVGISVGTLISAALGNYLYQSYKLPKEGDAK